MAILRNFFVLPLLFHLRQQRPRVDVFLINLCNLIVGSVIAQISIHYMCQFFGEEIT